MVQIRIEVLLYQSKKKIKIGQSAVPELESLPPFSEFSAELKGPAYGDNQTAITKPPINTKLLEMVETSMGCRGTACYAPGPDLQLAISNAPAGNFEQPFTPYQQQQHQ